MAPKKGKSEEKVKGQNKKAFTYSGGAIANKKRMQRLGDLQAKKDRKTVIDKTPQNEGPPYVVVVQGPPGVGKTTLIRSLVKHYSKTTLGSEIEGPVTLVSGRIRRLTFIECPANDMRAMLDLGKVADLVLLMVDGSRSGFEMETFEFINILQVHGFPRVMGVLTHLDGFKETKRLRKTKKTFKQRFWTELYDGAKMFYLSGIQYGNRYNKTEITNLARFISVQRFPPLSWRQSHPYVFGLRSEVTEQEDDEAKISVSIYGYVCGSRLREGQLAHIPGLGDYPISRVEQVVDPCPLPQHLAQMEKGGNAKDFSKSTGAPLRSLADKHKSIYAPYCDAEHVAVEKDAMYITLRNHSSHFTKDLNKPDEEVSEAESDESSSSSGSSDDSSEKTSTSEAVRLVREMQQLTAARRPKPAESCDSDMEGLQLVKNGVAVKTAPETEESEPRKSVPMRDVAFEFSGMQWDVSEDLEALVYDGAGGKKSAVKKIAKTRAVESLFSSDDEEDDLASTRLGSFVSEDVTDEGRHRVEYDDSDDEAISRLAEKLRRTKVFSMHTLQKEAGEVDEPQNDESGSESDCSETGSQTSQEKMRAKNAQEKEEAMAEEADPHSTRHLLEGAGGVVVSVARLAEAGAFEIGQFVRLVFRDVPAEFAAPLSTPSRPLVVGGIAAGAEARESNLLLHLKRHRWAPKILKNLDPVLVSAGWRRFQVMPLFAMEDRDKKMRMLKYTPEHMHCYCSIRAPAIPPGTGALFIRDWRAIPTYRVSASGTVMEGAEKTRILKKIKLVGEPYKVLEKTAFIRGMFTSNLEVEKSLHARIQTVSGIVGEVKKPAGEKGDFRASFSHKIQMSDLVVLKAWVPVETPPFCNPMIDLDIWPRMRTVNEIRRDAQVPIPHKLDSSYGASKQDRSKISKKFSKIRVPRKVMDALPFKSKQRVAAEKPQKLVRQEKADIERGAGAIKLPGSSLESKRAERQVRALVHGLKVVRSARIETKKEKKAEKKQLKEKREAFIVEKREAHTKETKKRRHAKAGFREKMNQKRMRLGGDD